MGIALTVHFILSAKNLTAWWIPVVIVLCVCTQYVFTELESALFSGKIPAPWSENATAKTKWIWSGAVTILLTDVFINIGGVGYVATFIRDSDTGKVLKTEFGSSDGMLKLLTSLIILVLALFVAIGPELLRIYAELSENPAPFIEVKAVKPEPEDTIPDGVKRAMDAARLAAKKKETPIDPKVPIISRRIK